MKKVIYIYVAILVGVFIGLSIFDQKGDFVIEKSLWSANKKFMEIHNDPSVVPDQSFDDLAQRYEMIIELNPEYSSLHKVYMLLGQVQEMKGDYQAARDKYQFILGKYKDDPKIYVQALSNIAKTHEYENQWAMALKIYNRIIKEFIGTEIGLSIPIYIANYYKGKNDYKRSMASYEKAIQLYKKMAADNSATQTGYFSMRYLANCYMDQNRWGDAIGTLSKLLNDYSSEKYLNPKTAGMILKTINVVAIYQLKDSQLAIDIYEKFINKNPGHPLNKQLEKIIESIKNVEEKNIQLTTQK